MEIARVKAKTTLKTMAKMKVYYLILLPIIAFFIIFSYIPMYGVILAFKDYRIVDGILGSPWVGLKHFENLFRSSLFYRAFFNTLIISSYRILFGFSAPIIFALLLNEIYNQKFKKLIQTISYLPYFISWVILSGIIIEIFSPSRGVVNYFITLFGGQSIYFLTEAKYFRLILISTGIWQSVGWSSIVYLAAISGIDIEQMDSAIVDGAKRFQIVRYITIPSIMPVIIIMFILSLGGIMNAGFDQIFNLYTPLVYSVGDIIDTYVYRVGLLNADYSVSTAIGLFKNIIGLILLLGTNFIIKKFNDGDYGIW